jgi:Polyketide cyclase / dehydrase and lipid transport
MATAYYSTVFQEPAASVWKIIRDFNNYAVWVGGVSESAIEEGKSGDTVGAVRSVHYQGRNIRQRLLALSDVERFQTYEFAGTPTLPVTGFNARWACSRSSMATVLLCNGGRISTASRNGARSSARRSRSGSANGSNRCARK